MLYSLVMLRDIFWKPYSHIYIIGDNASWVIDEEAKKFKELLNGMGLSANIKKRMYFNLPQIVYYTSQFSLNDETIYKSKNKIIVDYFHGHPDKGENFRKCFESLKKHHKEISKVRVSNKEMEELIKTSGIDSSKVARIPISIDIETFKPQTPEKRQEIRKTLGIPENAVVIGSFQKDGVGWNEGLEPKLIKGPDVFLKVIEKLKSEIPNIHVLLSGPARGFVKAGLTTLGIPFTHRYYSDYKKIADLYDALDLYIISSREEGGPKALLESMAKGVPVVTTAVGQCRDLVINEKNALITSVDDTNQLFNYSIKAIKDENLRKTLINNGYITAKENSYNEQKSMWKNLFSGITIE